MLHSLKKSIKAQIDADAQKRFARKFDALPKTWEFKRALTLKK